MPLAQALQLVYPRVNSRAATVYRMDVTDGAVPYPLTKRTDGIILMPLVTQLAHNIVILLRLPKGSHLADRMS